MARAQQVPAMSNPGVIVLNQNTKREQGKKAQLGNIAAAKNHTSVQLASVRPVPPTRARAVRAYPTAPLRDLSQPAVTAPKPGTDERMAWRQSCL